MPGRYVREGILTSEGVNSLHAHAELFYRRLINVVDDFGRYYAAPTLLRAACYPLQIDRVREADISRWLTECGTAGLILLYVVNGKAYLQLHKVDRPRSAQSKFPDPHDGCITSAKQLHNECKTNAPIAETVTTTEPPLSPPTGGSARRGCAETPAFMRFWAEWPQHFRKNDKKNCLRHWHAEKLDEKASAILTALARWKASAQWAKNDGEFIPAPLVWLRKERWLTADALKGAATNEDNGFQRREPTPDDLDFVNREGA